VGPSFEDLPVLKGTYARHSFTPDLGRDRENGQEPATPAGLRTGQLLVTGAALSIDNLAVGFALGTFHINLTVAAVVIGAVSVTMSLIVPGLGSRIGIRTGQRELIGGLVLIGAGAAVASGII
jgi:putative Mn2+ efflux pump MntP